MIHNDQELQGTQERIAFFCRLVAHMRQVESPADFRYMASSYLAEIEKIELLARPNHVWISNSPFIEAAARSQGNNRPMPRPVASITRSGQSDSGRITCLIPIEDIVT